MRSSGASSGSGAARRQDGRGWPRVPRDCQPSREVSSDRWARRRRVHGPIGRSSRRITRPREVSSCGVCQGRASNTSRLPRPCATRGDFPESCWPWTYWEGGRQHRSSRALHRATKSPRGEPRIGGSALTIVPTSPGFVTGNLPIRRTIVPDRQFVTSQGAFLGRLHQIVTFEAGTRRRGRNELSQHHPIHVLSLFPRIDPPMNSR